MMRTAARRERISSRRWCVLRSRDREKVESRARRAGDSATDLSLSGCLSVRLSVSPVALSTGRRRRAVGAASALCPGGSALLPSVSSSSSSLSSPRWQEHVCLRTTRLADNQLLITDTGCTMLTEPVMDAPGIETTITPAADSTISSLSSSTPTCTSPARCMPSPQSSEAACAPTASPAVAVALSAAVAEAEYFRSEGVAQLAAARLTQRRLEDSLGQLPTSTDINSVHCRCLLIRSPPVFFSCAAALQDDCDVRASQAAVLQREKALLIAQLSALRAEREEARADLQQRREEWEEHMATMADAIARQRREAEATQHVSFSAHPHLSPAPLNRSAGGAVPQSLRSCSSHGLLPL